MKTRSIRVMFLAKFSKQEMKESHVECEEERECYKTTAPRMLNKAPSHFCVKPHMLYKSKAPLKGGLMGSVIVPSCRDVCNRLLIGLPASCLLLLQPLLHAPTSVHLLPAPDLAHSSPPCEICRLFSPLIEFSLVWFLRPLSQKSLT